MRRFQIKMNMVLAAMLLAVYLCGCGASDGIPEAEQANSIENEEQSFGLLSEPDELEQKAQTDKIFKEQVNCLDGVTMEVVSNTSTSIKLTILNTTDLRIEYGEYYDLQVLQDGAWYSLSYLIDDWGFVAIGYSAKKDIPSEWYTDWATYHGVLDKGTYRIVKTVLCFSEQGNYTKYYLASEFEVE